MILNEDFFESKNAICYLGKGEVGGKAKGLIEIQSLLDESVKDSYQAFHVSIPKMIVLRTDIFDDFIQENKLYDVALSEKSDDKVALAFQQATLPFELLGDLRMIVANFNSPLVVRSSSLLEDAMHEPFAGVYGTKMTPNNQPDIDTRFRKLVEAIKYVYASTFFNNAKNYIRATNNSVQNEKMGLIIQTAVGKKFQNRFYPEFSGVVKSYNYYATEGLTPQDGIVNLAIGLGKEIVDGGVSWGISPSAPLKSAPFKSIDELLKNTQLKFWSINIGAPPPYDPISEKEFLLYEHFTTAEKDGTLNYLVSTYDPQSNRIWDGAKGPGPKVANFSPLLKNDSLEFSKLVKHLMEICEKKYNSPVEIEFAVNLNEKSIEDKNQFAFLQVRPMAISDEVISLLPEEEKKDNCIIFSNHVLGNGKVDDVSDIIIVKDIKLDLKIANAIAGELEKLNREFIKKGKKYILIGFGRWGTSDPWAGIPVDWSQISAAKIIIEASNQNLNQQMSQGSHFFHNVSSFKVLYFSITNTRHEGFIDWEWLDNLEVIVDSTYIKQLRVSNRIQAKVDGRTCKGVILRF